MSFASEVKEELSRVEPTCSHCESATLAALIRVEGTLLFGGPGKYRLEINTDSPLVARLVIKSLHTLYNLHTELTTRRSVLHKTPNWLIEVRAQPGLQQALVQLGILGENGLERGIVPSIVRKRCCRAAYLRGLFLGSGYISDPRGDFPFEITVETKTFADAIVELLAESGIQAKVMARRNTYIVYLKSGSAISDFLALVGAHHNALQMETERVRKSVRNDVNRQVNAEIANQAKTAAASVEQVMVIRKVLDHQDIHSLPVGLQEYIRLRVRHPDATLKELGALADPPLSKSAIYHRVRRLQEIADSID